MNTKSTLFGLLILLSVSIFGEYKDDFSGKYEVPVEDESLIPFAEFPLEGIEWEGDRFKYHLPDDLAETFGEKITFKKVGVDGDVTKFVSKFGLSDCKFVDQPVTRCEIDYNDKLADILLQGKEEVRQRLIDQGIQGEELIRRMMVVDGFSGDPIGILFIHHPHQ